MLDLHVQLKIMRIKILENDTIDIKDKTISIDKNHEKIGRETNLLCVISIKRIKEGKIIKMHNKTMMTIE